MLSAKPSGAVPDVSMWLKMVESMKHILIRRTLVCWWLEHLIQHRSSAKRSPSLDALLVWRIFPGLGATPRLMPSYHLVVEGIKV